jgi:hypothetical protein
MASHLDLVCPCKLPASGLSRPTALGRVRAATNDHFVDTELERGRSVRRAALEKSGSTERPGAKPCLEQILEARLCAVFGEAFPTADVRA